MKTFFDGVFMDNEKLESEGIKYPIKLEYYKTITIEENVKAKYGIEIVKTEYRKENVNVESQKFDNLMQSNGEAEKVLTLLKNNEVTPIAMQDVLTDMFTNI